MCEQTQVGALAHVGGGGRVIIRSSQKVKLKVKTEICASMGLFFFFYLFLIASGGCLSLLLT